MTAAKQAPAKQEAKPEPDDKPAKLNKDGLEPGKPVDTETMMKIERQRAAKAKATAK